jgi:fibronectin type 3 domain-containing protein
MILRWKKLLLALGVPLLLTACANVGPPQPPSLELPKPPDNLRAVRKGGRVMLSWTRPGITTDRQNLRGPISVLVCRTAKASMDGCGNPVGRMAVGAMLAGAPNSAQKPSASSRQKARDIHVTDTYTDILGNQIIPVGAEPVDGFVTYAVEVLNANGRGAGLSNQVRVSLAATLAPPRNFNATVSDQGVVLTWTGDSPGQTQAGVHYAYRVYRSLQGSQQHIVVGELPAGTERSLNLTDGNINWEKTYYYHAEAVTLIDQPEMQIEGDDTPEVKVFTRDVFPPAVPQGLQAAFSGPGQMPFIDLIWAPVTDADLAGYNIYRHKGDAAPLRVNAELVKTPAYRDQAVNAGKTYFYSVSSVDARGNESTRSAEASESVPTE